MSTSKLKMSASPLPCFPLFASMPPNTDTAPNKVPAPLPSFAAHQGLPHFTPFPALVPRTTPSPQDSQHVFAPRGSISSLDLSTSTSQQSSSPPLPALSAYFLSGSERGDEGSPSDSEMPRVTSLYTCHSGETGFEEIGDHLSEDPTMNEAKRLKRLVSNRASAKRSRQRKHDRLAELELQCAKLHIGHSETQRKLNEVLALLKHSEAENESLKRKLLAREEYGGQDRTKSDSSATRATSGALCSGTSCVPGTPGLSASGGVPKSSHATSAATFCREGGHRAAGSLTQQNEITFTLPGKRGMESEQGVKAEPDALRRVPSNIFLAGTPETQEVLHTSCHARGAHTHTHSEHPSEELTDRGSTEISGRFIGGTIAGEVQLEGREQISSGGGGCRRGEDEVALEMREVFSGILEESFIVDL